MKVFVYDYGQSDEAEYFTRYTKEMGIELGYTEEDLRPDNCDLASGSDFITITPNKVTPDMIDRLKELGVKMICTRSIGYDHIDVEYAKKVGMIVTHITYNIEGVAEYTVMMMLMVVRRIKEMLQRTMANDFTMNGLLAKELKDMSVGIIGAGRVGTSVLRDLSGFGCKLCYFNRTRNEEAERYAERLELNDLLSRCDIISLHLELNKDTFHFIDEEAFSKIKDGAILVNTARGPLVDTDALLESLRSNKISGAALDVVEGEFNYYYHDCRDKDLEDHYIGILRRMPNVVFTHHMAFYYEGSIRDRVHNCLIGMKAYVDGKEIPYRLA